MGYFQTKVQTHHLIYEIRNNNQKHFLEEAYPYQIHLKEIFQIILNIKILKLHQHPKLMQIIILFLMLFQQLIFLNNEHFYQHLRLILCYDI